MSCGLRVAGCALRVSSLNTGFGVWIVKPPKSYKDLEIYQLSYKLAVGLHELSLRLPRFEIYEEGNQIRRASKGITACIVEGYGRRRYKADFLKFLVYAHASCNETLLHLDFIKDTHKEYTEELEVFLQKYDELGRKINRFIQYVERNWR